MRNDYAKLLKSNKEQVLAEYKESKILLDKIKPRLKYTFNERVKREWNRISDKGYNYYIIAYVVDKRTLADEIDSYIKKINEISNYLAKLFKAETKLAEGKTIWLGPYIKIYFGKDRKLYRDFDGEIEQINTVQALDMIKNQRKSYRYVLSTSFIESIGEHTYNALMDENTLLLQKVKIGIGFYIDNRSIDECGKEIIEEILNDSIKKLNRKALEYFVKIPPNIYDHAVTKFKKLSQANIIHIPKVK